MMSTETSEGRGVGSEGVPGNDKRVGHCLKQQWQIQAVLGRGNNFGNNWPIQTSAEHAVNLL